MVMLLNNTEQEWERCCGEMGDGSEAERGRAEKNVRIAVVNLQVKL